MATVEILENNQVVGKIKLKTWTQAKILISKINGSENTDSRLSARIID